MATVKTTKLEVSILQKETIKPSSPTPSNLRTYRLSLIDQINTHVHMCAIYFYSTLSSGGGRNRPSSQQLKDSLSETLTRFYPFAGRLSEDMSFVNCNDAGVPFVEARANVSMSTILHQPKLEELNLLVPTRLPDMGFDWASLFIVQATFFQCGGVALCLSFSHKIGDGCTVFTFAEAWARINSGHLDAVVPDFTVVPSLFPSQHPLPIKPPNFDLKPDTCTSRRFVFHASKVIKLKAIAASKTVPRPSRAEAVSALLWKCSIRAARSSSGSTKKTSILTWPVDMRSRLKPPLPGYTIGNISTLIFVKHVDENDDVEEDTILPTMVCKLREKLVEFNNYMRKIQGEERVTAYLSWMGDYSKKMEVEQAGGADWCIHSSLCGFPFQQVDFGWGKPVWVNIPPSGVLNATLLTNTPDGQGIEAWISLVEEEMVLLERDPELLEFASVNGQPELVTPLI